MECVSHLDATRDRESERGEREKEERERERGKDLPKIDHGPEERTTLRVIHELSLSLSCKLQLLLKLSMVP